MLMGIFNVALPLKECQNLKKNHIWSGLAPYLDISHKKPS